MMPGCTVWKVVQFARLVRCGHCEQEVSKRTFYQHKRLYYDSKSKTWSHDARVYHEPSSSADDFRLPTIDSPSTSQSPPGLESDDDISLGDGKRRLWFLGSIRYLTVPGPVRSIYQSEVTFC